MKVGLVTYFRPPQRSSVPNPRDDRLEKALRRRGVTAVAVPWDDPEVDWTQFSGLVMRTAWNYHLHPDEFLVWVKRMKSLGMKLFNTAEAIEWNLHKRYLLDLQQQHGIAIPNTRLIPRHTSPVPRLRNLMEQLQKGKTWPVVVKPCVSGSAHQTYLVWFTDAEKFQPNFDQMVQNMDVLLQEYIFEIESSGEFSLVYFNMKYAYAVRKVPEPGDFRVQREYGGSVKAAEPSREVRDFCDKVMASLPADLLYSRVDVIERDDGKVFLMEVELIEPNLYFMVDSGECGAVILSDAIVDRFTT